MSIGLDFRSSFIMGLPFLRCPIPLQPLLFLLFHLLFWNQDHLFPFSTLVPLTTLQLLRLGTHPQLIRATHPPWSFLLVAMLVHLLALGLSTPPMCSHLWWYLKSPLQFLWVQSCRHSHPPLGMPRGSTLMSTLSWTSNKRSTLLVLHLLHFCGSRGRPAMYYRSAQSALMWFPTRSHLPFVLLLIFCLLLTSLRTSPPFLLKSYPQSIATSTMSSRRWTPFRFCHIDPMT